MNQITQIIALDEVKRDLDHAQTFYEKQKEGLGSYFRDSLLSDLESLLIFGGIHTQKMEYYCSFSKNFPYAIYYDIKETTVIIIAVLDMRQNPTQQKEFIEERDNR